MELANDPWAEIDAPVQLADDPWKEVDEPEAGAGVAWAGRPVSAEAVRDVAAQNNTSPSAIMRLGTWPGQLEARAAQTEVGALGLRVVEGIAGIGEQAAAAGARAVGRGDISARIHESRRERQQFLELIERGGATEQALGKRGARIYNNTVQSLGEIGTVGAFTGPMGIYSYTAGSAWEGALDDGERSGLQGGELIGHAGRAAVIEGGLTFLMGRAGAKLGITTLEESFSPALKNATRSFLRTPGMKAKLKMAAKELGGWASEGAEEMLIEGGHEINRTSSGMAAGLDWGQIFEAGASGVLGRGAAGAVRGLQSELQGFEKNMPEIVAGTKAAEIDIERGVNPFEVKDIEGAEFDKQTGRKSTSKQFQDSYREAVNFYVQEAAARGETGSLRKLEQDVVQLREEERQRAARINDSKKKNKGRAGESQVKTEPVQEQPLRTANERATFSIEEAQSRMTPAPPESIAPTNPVVNPYLLAPWESETRGQRRIRTLSKKVADHKETIGQLRQAIVDNKRLTKEQQDSALELVQENVPHVDQWKFSRGVLDATRPSLINKLIDRVDKHVTQRDHNLAVAGLKESFRKAANLRPEFADEVKAVRSSIDLKRFNNREAAISLRNWANENPQAVFSDSDKALLGRLEQQSVQSMTADDVRGLSDYVERLTYESAAKDRLIGNLESASLQDTGDRIARDIAKAPRKEMRSESFIQQAKADIQGVGIDPQLAQERTIGSMLFHEVAERPEVTMLQLGGELTENLYGKIKAARSQYKLRRAATNQFVSAAFNAVGLDHAESLSASMAYKVGLPSTKMEGWRSKERKIGGTKLTRGEAWQAALWSRDPVAFQNLREAGMELETGNRKLPPVTPMMLKEIFDFIGPEGEATVNAAFEHLNTYIIDGVNDANEKITGRPLTDKKNVVPMTKSEEDYARFITKDRMAAGFQEAAADSYSHLKRREGGVAPLRIPAGMDGIDMLMSHADRMHRFAAYAAPARNSEMILNHAPVKEAIKSKNGSRGYNQLVDAVRSEVAGIVSMDEITKGISALNHTVAGAIIGAKLSVMMAQPLDTIVAAPYDDGGMRHLVTGLNNEAVKRPPTKVFAEMKQVLGAHSGEWNGRYENGNYAGEVTNGIFKKRGYFRPSSIVEHGADSLKKSEFMFVAVPNYLAAKEAARQQLGLDPNDFDTYENDPAWVKAVVGAWESKTVRGSNSSDGLELSSGLRYAKTNPLAGLVLNFYNTAGKVYSLFSMAQNKLDAGDISGAGKFAASAMASTLLFAALQTAMTHGDKEKKNKSFWQRMLVRSAKNIVGLHPALGQTIGDEIVGPALGMPSYSDNPILLAEVGVKAAVATTQLASRMWQEADATEEPGKLVKQWVDFGRSAGPLLGVPTPGIIDIGQRIQEGTLFPGLQPPKPGKPKMLRTRKAMARLL